MNQTWLGNIQDYFEETQDWSIIKELKIIVESREQCIMTIYKVIDHWHIWIDSEGLVLPARAEYITVS